MAAILVKPNELKKTGKELRSSAAKLTSALREVDEIMRSLDSTRFEGTSAASLRTRYRQCASGLNNAPRMIISFASQLENLANQFSTEDRKLDSSPFSFIGAVILPWLGDLFKKFIGIFPIANKQDLPEAPWQPKNDQNATGTSPAPENPSGNPAQKDHGDEELGSLSSRYESNGDPGRVSSGNGDPGSVSYGAYQMTSRNGGTVAVFLKSEFAQKWASEFDGLTPGTPEFSAKWKEIAAREPDAFLAAQHGYIQGAYYEPAVQKVAGLGIVADDRSHAFREVLWSTAVQFGSGSAKKVVENALAAAHLDPATASDEDLIKAIYAERGRTNADGSLAWFGSSSEAVQKGVANRFVNECAQALQMLAAEKARI